VSRRVG